MMRRFTIFLLLIFSFFHAETKAESRADSLLTMARMWREMGNLDHAIYLFEEVGSYEATYEKAVTQYMLGRNSAAIATAKRLKKIDNDYALDASVLIGQCRENQGFEFAAKRIYIKTTKKGSSAAATKFAQMMYRKGHLDKAQTYAQKAIGLNISNAEAHMVLASVMANKGARFKAMMPLYYYLIINTLEDNQRLAYAQLTSLWRRSAKAINIFRQQSPSDPFNDAVDAQIEAWATDDAITQAEGSVAVEMLLDMTEKLFNYLLENSELNLDFWQLTYTDFFVKLPPRNFVEPFVYFISSATHQAAALEYVSREAYLFNEFRLWMEAQ